MRSLRLVLLFVAVSIGLGGCAAIGLSVAALGAGAFSAGAGAAVQAGTEYTRSGAVFRTFSLPLADMRLALSDALERMELAVVTDEQDGEDRVIVARASDREIDLRLAPVTRTVTRLRLVVKEGFARKDQATATEIVTQTERSVEEYVPVKRAARRNGASSLARGGRR